MSDANDKKSPIKQDSGKLKTAEKQARLADALRANLRRRKDQSRAQMSGHSPGADKAKDDTKK